MTDNGNDLGGGNQDLGGVIDIAFNLGVELDAIDRLKEEVDPSFILETLHELDHEGVLNGFQNEELVLHVLNVIVFYDKRLFHGFHGQQGRFFVVFVLHESDGAEGALAYSFITIPIFCIML